MTKSKFFIGALLALTSFVCSAANNCPELKVNALPEVRALLVQREVFELPKAVCEKLAKEDVGLFIRSDTTVISNQAVAWVTIALVKNDSNIVSNYEQRATRVTNISATKKAADLLLVLNVIDVLKAYDFDAAFKTLAPFVEKQRKSQPI